MSRQSGSAQKFITEQQGFVIGINLAVLSLTVLAKLFLLQKNWFVYQCIIIVCRCLFTCCCASNHMFHVAGCTKVILRLTCLCGGMLGCQIIACD